MAMNLYPSAFVDAVFRIFYASNKLNVDSIFRAIYDSDFYSDFVNFPLCRFGDSVYDAYSEMALQAGYKPQKQKESYYIDLDSRRLRLAINLFESFRRRHPRADAGYLAEVLIGQGFFRGIIDCSLSEGDGEAIIIMLEERTKKVIADLNRYNEEKK